jgi:hypothetical protein
MKKKTLVNLDPASWQLGHDDGKNGTKKHEQKAKDRLAYLSGWIEGDAARKKLVLNRAART